jgi:hypothetical protein
MQYSIFGLVLLLLTSSALAVAQSKSSTDKAWPSLVVRDTKIHLDGEWDFSINIEQLGGASVGNPLDIQRCQSGATCRPYVSDFFSKWNGQFGIDKSVLRSDVIMHHYPRVLVGGQGRITGTYVFFLPAQNVFFLWGDCAMNHVDPVLGPFAGDPRSVLKRLTE